MEKKQLVCSDVDFDAQSHTYKLNGLPLSGVTPIVKWLFPDTYQGIPQSVLEQAAAHGSMVHSKVELYDSLGIVPDDEYKDFVDSHKWLCEQWGLKIRCSEYLVSDEQYIASCIDKVCEDNSLIDIKSTSKLHVLNVCIQLSIYAMLFEQQNKGEKVPHIYAEWLPKAQYGNAEIRELKRVPAEFCARLVEAFIKGEDSKPYREELDMMGFHSDERKEGDVPYEVQPLVDELVIIKKELDKLTEREKEIKTALKVAMQHAGEQKWISDNFQCSIRAAYEKESFDSAAFKKNEPAMYESYKKVTKYAETLTYKVL
jgi:hypothetical protein